MYAGKFDTPQQLEEGYKQSSQEALRLKTERDAFKAERDAFESKINTYKAPDKYLVDSNAGLDDKDTELLVSLAKEAGLTQDQFYRVVKKTSDITKDLTKSHQEKQLAFDREYNEKLSKYDKTELEAVTKFVKSEFAEVADHLLQNIGNPDVFSKLKKVQESMVNNQSPGMGSLHPLNLNNDINALPQIRKEISELNTKLDSDPMNAAEHKSRIIELTKRQVEINKANAQKTT